MKISRSESVQRWRNKYPEKARARYKKDREKRDFGTERAFILERDNYQCRSCGKKEGMLHIHHIDGNGTAKKEKNNDIENLVTLCPSCHKKADGIMLREKRKGVWSLNFDKCVECGKTDSKHASKGVCNRCYNLKRREYKAEYWRKHYSGLTKN